VSAGSEATERAAAVARRLAAEAAAARQRRTLVLAGADRGWTRAAARAALAAAGLRGRLWITDAAPEGECALAGAAARDVLGTELDALVLDAFAGLDPDALGAAAGAVRGGGLLLLLTPPLDAWPRWPDPERARITVAGYPPEAVGGRFLARLARVLREAPGTAICTEAGEVRERPAPPPPATPAAADDPDCLTPDQAAAVAAVVRAATGPRRRPAVLVADRGRGKSAALGIAAARLVASGAMARIAVTAPRPEAAAPVLAHAARLLPGTRASRTAVLLGERTVLEFLPPDRLAHEGTDARLVLVDEAAAIPAPLLARLLDRHARLAFATTVHGYEGTGRGFDLRFGPLLEARTRGVHRVRLETPVRWAPGDPVEALVFRALLLDAEPAPEAEVAGARTETCAAAREDREALAADEPRLAQVFGLLVQAHYRTRPFDLRCLLDGPNLHVWTLRCGTARAVAATALVADEGGFDATIATRIWAGVTRPHGHLVPESLAVHLGLEAGARLRCARIMRIAAHPAARRRGLGLKLVEAVAGDAAARGFDLAGTAFGADAGLLGFWRRAGFVPVRVGVRRGTASGAHAVLMLRGLTPAGRELLAHARATFLERLPAQLADPLRELEPELAAALLAGGPARWAAVGPEGWVQLAAFAFGHRGYEECLEALRPLAAAALADPETAAGLEPAARHLLVAKALQGHPWPEAARRAGLAGRAAAQAALRAALRPILLARGGGTVRRTLVRLRAAGLDTDGDF